MRTPPQKRWLTPGLGGAIVAVAVAGGVLLLLGGPGGLPTGAPATPGAAPGLPDPATSATAPGSPSPSASTVASASPSPSASPQGDTPLTDLAGLLPGRVGGFRRHRTQEAAVMRRQPGAVEARRVTYVSDRGIEVTHVVGLFSDSGAAGDALVQRRARLLRPRGARVTDSTPLLDADGERRGRLVEVRKRNGDVVVLWRNRNLVGMLGPGRAQLHRRLYERWPY